MGVPTSDEVDALLRRYQEIEAEAAALLARMKDHFPALEEGRLSVEDALTSDRTISPSLAAVAATPLVLRVRDEVLGFKADSDRLDAMYRESVEIINKLTGASGRSSEKGS